jgi:hypothetical protein
MLSAINRKTSTSPSVLQINSEFRRHPQFRQGQPKLRPKMIFHIFNEFLNKCFINQSIYLKTNKFNVFEIMDTFNLFYNFNCIGKIWINLLDINFYQQI